MERSSQAPWTWHAKKKEKLVSYILAQKPQL